MHQGSALIPFLFAVVMDRLTDEVRQESPRTMFFADDTVVVVAAAAAAAACRWRKPWIGGGILWGEDCKSLGLRRSTYRRKKREEKYVKVVEDIG